MVLLGNIRVVISNNNEQDETSNTEESIQIQIIHAKIIDSIMSSGSTSTTWNNNLEDIEEKEGKITVNMQLLIKGVIEPIDNCTLHQNNHDFFKL